MSFRRKLIEKIQRSDRIKFILTFLSIIGSSIWLSRMMLRAWFDSPTGTHPVNVFAKSIGLSSADVGAFLIGIYFGFAVPLFFDELRSTQGGIAILGGIFMYAIAVLFGPIKPFSAAFSNILLALVGLFVTLYVVGGKKLFKNTNKRLKFPRANKGIAYFSLLILITVWIQAHVNYNTIMQSGTEVAEVFPSNINIMILDGAAVLAGYLAIKWFVGYEAKSYISVLGPKRVGKTHFMIGLFEEVDTYIGVTEDENIDGLHTRIYETEKWLEENLRQDFDYLEFEYIDGRIPPQLRTISSLDYPGELFEFIPDALDYPENAAKVANEINLPDNTGSEATSITESNKAGASEDDLASDGGSVPWRESGGNGDEDEGENDKDTSDESKRIAHALVNLPSSDRSIISQITRSDIVLFIFSMDSILYELDNLESELMRTQSETIFNSDGKNSPSGGQEGSILGLGDSDSQQEGNLDTVDNTSGKETEINVPDLELETCSNIINKLQKQDKRIFFVATKSDIFASSDDIPYTPSADNYDQFQREVTREFEKIGKFKAWMDERRHIAEEVYPVYIKEDSNGKPDFGGQEEKQLQTFGFRQLIEEIEYES